MHKTKTATDIEFVDYKHSIFFDMGAPVFITEDNHYAFASTLENFQLLFSKMSKSYLESIDVEVFKNMFSDAVDHYGYEKTQAKVVLCDCINTIENSRTTSTNNTI